MRMAEVEDHTNGSAARSLIYRKWTVGEAIPALPPSSHPHMQPWMRGPPSAGVPIAGGPACASKR